MPFYEYECSRCGHRFEQRNTMDSRHSALCPRCNSSVQLLISLSDFRFAVPITLRTHEGKILDSKSDCGGIPPHRRPSVRERDNLDEV